MMYGQCPVEWIQVVWVCGVNHSDLCGFLGPWPHGGDTVSVSLVNVIMFMLLLLLYCVKWGARSVSSIVQWGCVWVMFSYESGRLVWLYNVLWADLPWQSGRPVWLYNILVFSLYAVLLYLLTLCLYCCWIYIYICLMVYMHSLKCFDQYHETPESRESVDQKRDGDDSASPRVTPRAPTPFRRAPEGSEYWTGWPLDAFNNNYMSLRYIHKLWQIIYNSKTHFTF